MNDDRNRAWAAAGHAAAGHVEDGMRVGLGTGRAAAAGIAKCSRTKSPAASLAVSHFGVTVAA